MGYGMRVLRRVRCGGCCMMVHSPDVSMWYFVSARGRQAWWGAFFAFFDHAFGGIRGDVWRGENTCPRQWSPVCVGVQTYTMYATNCSQEWLWLLRSPGRGKSVVWWCSRSYTFVPSRLFGKRQPSA